MCPPTSSVAINYQIKISIIQLQGQKHHIFPKKTIEDRQLKLQLSFLIHHVVMCSFALIMLDELINPNIRFITP